MLLKIDWILMAYWLRFNRKWGKDQELRALPFVSPGGDSLSPPSTPPKPPPLVAPHDWSKSSHSPWSLPFLFSFGDSLLCVCVGRREEHCLFPFSVILFIFLLFFRKQDQLHICPLLCPHATPSSLASAPSTASATHALPWRVCATHANIIFCFLW